MKLLARLLWGLIAICSLAKAELRLACEVQGRTGYLCGVTEKHLLVRVDGETREAPGDAGWRLEGDLRAEARLAVWSPNYDVRRVPPYQITEKSSASYFGHVSIAHYTGLDYAGHPLHSEFLRQWPNGINTPSALVMLWVVNGTPVEVKVGAIPSTNEKSSFDRQEDFKLTEGQAAGQAAIMLWSDGGFVAPVLAFSTEDIQTAAIDCVLNDATNLEKAIARGLTLDARDTSKSTLLHYAAEAGATDAARVLIHASPKLLDLKNARGQTALHWAAIKGRTETVELLLNASAEVDATNEVKATPLLAACSRGHLGCVRSLLAKGADWNVSDSSRYSPLGVAIDTGYPDLADVLLKAHARFIRDEQTARVLTRKAGLGDIDTTRWLIAHAVDADFVDQKQTALMAGATRGSRALAELLIKEGRAKPNRQNELGDTALMVAAGSGNFAYAEGLIALGADVKIAKKNGVTALHMAAVTNQVACAELLLKHGADYHAKDGRGLTPLNLALLSRSRETVDLLVEAGARIELKSKAEGGAIESALLLDQADLVTAALADGWSPNAKLTGDWSALQVAKVCHAEKCAKLLAETKGIVDEPLSVPMAKASALDEVPRLIQVYKPEDPREPSEEFWAETVNVRCIINSDGKVLFPRISGKANVRLKTAVLDAISFWRFAPLASKGKPVAIEAVLPVQFPSSAQRSFSATQVDEMARVLEQPRPQYPLQERRLGIGGRVTVRFLVAANGSVDEVIVMETTDPAFSQSALDCVKQWKFKPAIYAGHPVPVWMMVPIIYSIEG